MQPEKLTALQFSLNVGRIMGALVAIVGISGTGVSMDALIKGGDEAGAVAGLGPGFVLLTLTGILLALGYRLGLWLSYVWLILGAYPIVVIASEWSPNFAHRNITEILVYGSSELLFLVVVTYFQKKITHLRKIRLRSPWSSKTPG